MQERELQQRLTATKEFAQRQEILHALWILRRQSESGIRADKELAQSAGAVRHASPIPIQVMEAADAFGRARGRNGGQIPETIPSP
jgi:hypothetical protein